MYVHSGLGGGKGSQSCYSGQCPPENEFGLAPQFYPAIAELGYHNSTPEGSNKEARRRIFKAKADLVARAAALVRPPGSEIAQKLLKAVEATDKWVRSVNPPFPDPPLLPVYRTAQQVLKDLEEQSASMLSPEEEQQILDATLPMPEAEESFLTRNFVPIVVGGGALFLGVVGFFLLSK